MDLKNEQYDVGKWMVLIFLPSFAVFISGMGELYGWVNASVIVTTINLFAVFLGSILQISSQKYNNNNNYPGGRTVG